MQQGFPEFVSNSEYNAEEIMKLRKCKKEFF